VRNRTPSIAVLDDVIGESLRVAMPTWRGGSDMPRPTCPRSPRSRPCRAGRPARTGPTSLDCSAPVDWPTCSVPARPPPQDWAPVFSMDGVQTVAGAGASSVRVDAAVVELGSADVPDMLRLAELTRPGPFWPRSIELGTYVGVRENGVLVSMAGERLRPPGWTEISAVCTAPQARGRGHASALVHALAGRITERDDRPFLHVAADNAGAIGLYTRLGFTVRRRVRFHGYRVPGRPSVT
jgi:ribosomal protein S18 acetylase RimI-like enzyme